MHFLSKLPLYRKHSDTYLSFVRKTYPPSEQNKSSILSYPLSINSTPYTLLFAFYFQCRNAKSSAGAKVACNHASALYQIRRIGFSHPNIVAVSPRTFIFAPNFCISFTWANRFSNTVSLITLTLSEKHEAQSNCGCISVGKSG